MAMNMRLRYSSRKENERKHENQFLINQTLKDEIRKKKSIKNLKKDEGQSILISETSLKVNQKN